MILDFYNNKGERNELVKMLIESNYGKIGNSEDNNDDNIYEYFVNLNPNTRGGIHHEIHRSDCQYLPAYRNRRSLGFHLAFDTTIEIAKKAVNADVDGCYYCCNENHTR